MKFLLNSSRKGFFYLAITGGIFVLWFLFSQPKPSYQDAEQPLSLPSIESHVEPIEETATSHWQEITTKSGDSLATVFQRLGISAKTLFLIMDDNPHAKTLTQIQPNQTIKFLIEGTTLKQLILPISETKSLTITQEEDETYQTKLETTQTYTKPEVVHATVNQALYLAAKKADIPYVLIQQMADILHWQLNFSRDVRKGDTFTIQYEAHYIDNKRVKIGDILAVSYNNNGTVYQAVRHKLNSGKVAYFTPEGKSLQKAFNRYPINFSHISSSFNLRRMHPILKKVRPHRGIDLAAPIGTPIKATSDGRISSIGYDSGYGNRIKIRHQGTYATVYAHMLKFRKGLKRGDYVKRGEIIGYVGQTGLADGPHCHYEFRINDVPKNPATVMLPSSTPVPESELAEFRARANTSLAELERMLPESSQMI